MFSEHVRDALSRFISKAVPLGLSACGSLFIALLLVNQINAYRPSAHQFVGLHVTCLTNSEFGVLTRGCAQRMIAHSPRFSDVEIVDVTGILDLGTSVKRVEFDWQDKVTGGIDESENQRPGKGRGTAVFRRYDDGWRVSE